MIDLSGVPAEIRERLAEWLALAETEGVAVVGAKLAEQNERQTGAFRRAAVAVERLLRE